MLAYTKKEHASWRYSLGEGRRSTRNEWRLAEVIETVVDKDGLVRRVKIRFEDRNLGKDGKRLNKPSVVERQCRSWSCCWRQPELPDISFDLSS